MIKQTDKCKVCGHKEFTYKSAFIEEGKYPCCCRCYYLVTKNGTEPFRTLAEHMEESKVEETVLRCLRSYLVTAKKYYVNSNTKLISSELLSKELEVSKSLFNTKRELLNYKQEIELYKYLVSNTLPSMFNTKLSKYQLKEIVLTNYGNDDYEIKLNKIKKNIE